MPNVQSDITPTPIRKSEYMLYYILKYTVCTGNVCFTDYKALPLCFKAIVD